MTKTTGSEDVANRVVVVTGGGSGIGRATARRFARQGYRVVVADVSPDGASETVELISAEGGEATAIVADVSSADDVDRLFSRIDDRYGRLDVAINNAGIALTGQKLVDIDEVAFDRTVAINLKGVWLCMRREIPMMLERGGAIVNMSSVVGLVGNARTAAYSATKHGVIGLTKTAALEYSASGIRINAVCPALIETPLSKGGRLANDEIKAQQTALHPIGRFGQAEEVAEAMLWLASPQASFITGTAIPVDGGWTAQ